MLRDGSRAAFIRNRKSGERRCNFTGWSEILEEMLIQKDLVPILWRRRFGGFSGVQLEPNVFPFEDTRVVCGRIGKRNFERRFKPLDELALEIDAFATAIQTKQPVEPDGVQGHRDIVILRAIYESAASGQSTTINYGERL